MKSINVKNVAIGPNQPLAIIAGPCVAESKELCLQIGQAVRDKCQQLNLGFIFKASFDKANRSSIHSQRGPGIEKGLKMIGEVGQELGVPTTTDLHEPGQAKAVGQAVDMIQIPAFLCRQTDLLVAAAQTGKPVNVKKGQFLSPGEMKLVVGKLTESGADQAGIMLTERGTFFGYNRLVNDFIGLGQMMELGWPVCFDSTHSTQMPGADKDKSGGQPKYAPLLARAAVAAGVQSVFIETHTNPPTAMSDSATMLSLEQTLALLEDLTRLSQYTVSA